MAGLATVPARAQTGGALGDAVQACVAATVRTGVDDGRLVAAGWQGLDLALDARDKEPLRVYTRGRGSLLVVGTGGGAAKSGCNVLVPLSGRSGYDQAVSDLTASLGAGPVDRRKNNEILWIVGQTGVTLAPAGLPDRPAVHAIVIYLGENK